MYLAKLTFDRFRNLDAQTVQLDPGFNYLHGPNGAGKTAILEAVYLLARGRSFRTSRVASIIQNHKDDLVVRASVASASGQRHQMAISKNRAGKTELRLDGNPQSRTSSLAQYLPVQTLLPDAAELILGGPGHRRGFLDWGVFHVEHQFVDTSRNYRRVLAQRNAWLKTLARPNHPVESDPWLAQLSTLATRISEFRHRYIEAFIPVFARTLFQLSPNLRVKISYDWGGLESADSVHKKLTESWSRDVKFGVTHRGPHRADLMFKINDQSAAEQISRGQAKLIASAALLAQAELLRTETGDKSVFLIDDFGAELDIEHWRRFLETLMALECQVIATSTEPYENNPIWVGELKETQLFHVKQGRVNAGA